MKMIDLSKPIFLLIAVCAVSFASFAQTNADIDFDIDSIPIQDNLSFPRIPQFNPTGKAA